MKWILRIIILCVIVGLSACGQNGPLYLPDKKPLPQKKDRVNQNNHRQVDDLDLVE